MISLRDLQGDFLSFTLGDTGLRVRPWIVERGLSAEQRPGRLSQQRTNGFRESPASDIPSAAAVEW